MVTMNQPIMLLLTVIQISNKNLKFQLNRVVYQCLRNICTKFQVDTSFLFWVFLNNLTSIYSIWQRPWNHSTNIFIRIFLLHRIHCPGSVCFLTPASYLFVTQLVLTLQLLRVLHLRPRSHNHSSCRQNKCNQCTPCQSSYAGWNQVFSICIYPWPIEILPLQLRLNDIRQWLKIIIKQRILLL